MQMITKYHGERVYSEGEVITFEKGLPGFEELKKFILFPVEENEFFSILHSIENDEVGMVTVSPFNVVGDYEINIDEATIERLKIKEEEDVLLLNTVTLDSRVENITVNLKAPIVININQRLGEQIILDTALYQIKHPLIKG